MMNKDRMLPVEVRFIKTHPNAKLPTQGSDGAAGFDLYAVEDVILQLHAATLVKTGLKIALPFGYEGQVRPRSGLALKHGVTVVNAPGTIDEDYRGPVGVVLMALEKVYHIKAGDRIAQLVVKEVVPRVKMMFVDAFDETGRGEDGYGSTGT